MYRILIVDDEKIERNGIRFLLQKMNMEFEISEAVNGLDALEKIHAQEFDILLTDVKMPFMDGIELIDNIVKEKKQLRCVIFSGCSEFDYARQAIRLGVVDYILKPVDPAEFRDTLQKVVDDLETARAEADLKSKSMEFMYDHALYMLINGADIDKIQRECPGITMEFKQPEKMLLVEFDHDFFGRRDVDLKDNSRLSGLGISRFLNLNQQQEILFIGDEVDAVGVARELVKIIKSDYNDDCYIAISSDIKDLSYIPAGFDEMEVLMDNKFYHPEVHVFYQNMEDENSGVIQLDDDTLMKQMKQDIKMKDVEALREHFKRFSEKYRHKKEYSQIYIKFLFSNLLKDIYASVDGTSEADLNKDIEKLYMSTDFHSLTALVDVAIDRLEKCFEGQNTTDHREVEIVKQYIYRNYGSELGIDMLADMVYLAPSYLSTIFKKETGQNLSKFIKAYRMEQAKDMLENTMAKIVDIGAACGYPNVSYFCSSFREFYGVSPQKFRENGGIIHE